MMTFQPTWDKTGSLITGDYYGHQFNGIIEHSRITHGGDVQYKVRLNGPINMGNDINQDWRSTILIDREADKNHYTLLDAVDC